MTQPLPAVYGGLRGVQDDDLVQGCVRWINDQPELVGLLSHFPGPEDEPYEPYIFQQNMLTNLEGRQGTALVISYAGEWSGGNNYNRMSFPRLSFRFYADPQRDISQNVTDPTETRLRLVKLFRSFDLYLNWPLDPSLMNNSVGEGNVIWWGSIRVTNCARISEPTITIPEDGDQLAILESYYAITTG